MPRGPERTRDLVRGRRVARDTGTVAGAWDGWLAPRVCLATAAGRLTASARLRGTVSGTRGAGCALAGLLQPRVPPTCHHSVRAIPLSGVLAHSKKKRYRMEPPPPPAPALPDKRRQLPVVAFGSAFLFVSKACFPSLIFNLLLCKTWRITASPLKGRFSSRTFPSSLPIP